MSNDRRAKVAPGPDRRCSRAAVVRVRTRSGAVGGASPRLTWRELLGVALLGIVLALAMHWPLPLHMGRDIAQDLGDPLVQAWQVAWDGHALKTQPAELFQANTFWPLPDSLAISDALVGYAPAGLIGSGTRAAIARYDALFLFAYALCFPGAWLLARELGVGRAGAASPASRSPTRRGGWSRRATCT